MNEFDPRVRAAFLNALAGPESAGKYNIRYDGSARGASIGDMSHHPNILVPGPAGKTSAAGRYMFTGSTWNTIPQNIRPDFSPQSQDNAAWYHANQVYRQKTGGDLGAELMANGLSPRVQSALGNTWRGIADNPHKAQEWYQATLAGKGPAIATGGGAMAYASPGGSTGRGGAVDAINQHMGGTPMQQAMTPGGQGSPTTPRSFSDGGTGPDVPSKMTPGSGVPSDATPMSHAMNTTDQPLQYADASGGAPSAGPFQGTVDPNSDSGTGSSAFWDKMGGIGNGLMLAGAALMAADNPSGANALVNAARSAQKLEKDGWKLHNIAPDGTAVFSNGPELKTLQIPGYNGSTNKEQYRGIETGSDGKNYDTFFDPASGTIRRVPTDMRTASQAKEAQKAAAVDTAALDPGTKAAMLARAQDYYMGNDKAYTRASMSEKLAMDKLFMEDYREKNGVDLSGYDLAGNRVRVKELFAASTQHGKQMNNVTGAIAELNSTTKAAKELLADPEFNAELVKHNIPVNLVMQKGAKYWQDAGAHKLAAYAEALTSAGSAYATVLNRGGATVPVHVRKQAEALLNTTQTPQVAAEVMDYMGQTGARMQTAMTEGWQKYQKSVLSASQDKKYDWKAEQAKEDEAFQKERDDMNARLAAKYGTKVGTQAPPTSPTTPSQASPATPAAKQPTVINQLPQGAVQGPDGYYRWTDPQTGKKMKARAQ